jgi:hypothetical protein
MKNFVRFIKIYIYIFIILGRICRIISVTFHKMCVHIFMSKSLILSLTYIRELLRIAKIFRYDRIRMQNCKIIPNFFCASVAWSTQYKGFWCIDVGWCSKQHIVQVQVRVAVPRNDVSHSQPVPTCRISGPLVTATSTPLKKWLRMNNDSDNMLIKFIQ